MGILLIAYKLQEFNNIHGIHFQRVISSLIGANEMCLQENRHRSILKPFKGHKSLLDTPQFQHFQTFAPQCLDPPNKAPGNVQLSDTVSVALDCHDHNCGVYAVTPALQALLVQLCKKAKPHKPIFQVVEVAISMEYRKSPFPSDQSWQNLLTKSLVNQATTLEGQFHHLPK